VPINANLEEIVYAIMEGNARLLAENRIHVWYEADQLGCPRPDGDQISAWGSPEFTYEKGTEYEIWPEHRD